MNSGDFKPAIKCSRPEVIHVTSVHTHWPELYIKVIRQHKMPPMYSYTARTRNTCEQCQRLSKHSQCFSGVAESQFRCPFQEDFWRCKIFYRFCVEYYAALRSKELEYAQKGGWLIRF